MRKLLVVLLAILPSLSHGSTDIGGGGGAFCINEKCITVAEAGFRLVPPTDQMSRPALTMELIQEVVRVIQALPIDDDLQSMLQKNVLATTDNFLRADSYDERAIKKYKKEYETILRKYSISNKGLKIVALSTKSRNASESRTYLLPEFYSDFNIRSQALFLIHEAMIRATGNLEDALLLDGATLDSLSPDPKQWDLVNLSKMIILMNDNKKLYIDEDVAGISFLFDRPSHFEFVHYVYQEEIRNNQMLNVDGAFLFPTTSLRPYFPQSLMYYHSGDHRYSHYINYSWADLSFKDNTVNIALYNKLPELWQIFTNGNVKNLEYELYSREFSCPETRECSDEAIKSLNAKCEVASNGEYLTAQVVNIKRNNRDGYITNRFVVYVDCQDKKVERTTILLTDD